MTDEEELKILERNYSQARPHQKPGILAMINNKKRLIEHKRLLGDRIVANATEKAAHVQVQAIIESAGSVLEAMNRAAELLGSEARQLSVAIKEADNSSSLVGRALVIVGSAAWFSFAWDVAKNVTGDGAFRVVIMGIAVVLLAVVLAWSGVFKGLFGKEEVSRMPKTDSRTDQPQEGSK